MTSRRVKLHEKYKYHYDNLGDFTILGKRMESIDSSEINAIKEATLGEAFEDALKWD